MKKRHSVYILRCADGTFYTGYATDVMRRVAEHNGLIDSAAGRTAAARYTRGRRPVTLMYTEAHPTRSEAQKREYAIKRMSKARKSALMNGLS